MNSLNCRVSAPPPPRKDSQVLRHSSFSCITWRRLGQFGACCTPQQRPSLSDRPPDRLEAHHLKLGTSPHESRKQHWHLQAGPYSKATTQKEYQVGSQQNTCLFCLSSLPSSPAIKSTSLQNGVYPPHMYIYIYIYMCRRYGSRSKCNAA